MASRMIDDILVGSLTFDRKSAPDNTQTLVRSLLEEAEIFVIDNVAEYFFDKVKDEQEGVVKWKMRDFPNIAPPFEFYWMEYKATGIMREPIAPVEIEANERGELIPERWGVLVEAHEIEPGVSLPLNYGLQSFGAVPANVEKYIFSRDDARWYTRHTYFSQQHKRESPVLLGMATFFVAEDGTCVNQKIAGRWLLNEDALSKQEYSDRIITMTRFLSYPALLATSFLHCRNVSTERVAPNPKLAKKHAKKHARPLVTFKTLKIEPMTRALRESGAETGAEGFSRSLHIRRGHFKHFGEKWRTKRLFGKHEGMFFWDQRVQGTSKKGVVVKDYQVNAAREEQS